MVKNQWPRDAKYEEENKTQTTYPPLFICDCMMVHGRTIRTGQPMRIEAEEDDGKIRRRKKTHLNKQKEILTYTKRR